MKEQLLFRSREEVTKYLKTKRDGFSQYIRKKFPENVQLINFFLIYTVYDNEKVIFVAEEGTTSVLEKAKRFSEKDAKRIASFMTRNGKTKYHWYIDENIEMKEIESV